MYTEFVFAGFGGQGVLTAGMLLAHTGAENGKEVTWIPSYGSEMRGGTANCTVKVGDEEIPSPFAKRIDVLAAMNGPSLAKFAKQVKKGGHIIVNSSIVHEAPELEGVNIYMIPVSEMAQEMGNPRSANICVLGAAVAASDILSREALTAGISSYFKKGDNTSNIAVFNAGYDAVKKES
ncbi:MAG: 2-oxoacid:acceptor oxidoreductase family protein [Candidatus Heteroscillospira sp.]|jgi:2-oxoglutarate ferredoxin oxidoreductase subunit gamma